MLCDGDGKEVKLIHLNILFVDFSGAIVAGHFRCHDIAILGKVFFLKKDGMRAQLSIGLISVTRILAQVSFCIIQISIIMKTCPCNVYSLIRHFLYSNIGVCRVIFSTFA